MPELELQFSHSTDRKTQDAALAKMRKLAGVAHAIRVDPESEDPVISRMCSVAVADASQVGLLKSQLAKLPGVETVDESTERKLVW